MNQTRVFLIFAWLMVAMLLWMEWGKERAAPPAATPAASAAAAGGQALPAAVPVATAGGDAAVPTAAAVAAPSPAITGSAASAAPRIQVRTDVLDLVLDGGGVLQADLPRYPQSRQPAWAA